PPRCRSRPAQKKPMKNGTKIKLAVVVLAAVLIGGSACRRSQPVATNPPAVNAFGWELDDGQRGRISDYKGKVLLLDFYATWCEPCRDETPHLVQLHQHYASQGLQIIGLNV